MNEVTVFAPATVSNVVCGFDCLGFAIDEPADKITVRKIGGVDIRIVHHDDLGVSTVPRENVAGVALQAMLGALNADLGFEVEITKGIKPGSGIGSSAASSCGAVVAANYVIGEKFSKSDLVDFAMEGEKLASGTRHADNVAPCIFGGFTLVRSIRPLDIVQLDLPALFVTVIHPQIEINTSEARAMLPADVSLGNAVRQWSNLGAFIAGMAKGDLELVGRSMEDVIIEPVRKSLIPAFDELKAASISCGAIGGGISGSGPSVFMLSRNRDIAKRVEDAMDGVYSRTGIDFKTYVSRVGRQGVRSSIE